MFQVLVKGHLLSRDAPAWYRYFCTVLVKDAFNSRANSPEAEVRVKMTFCWRKVSRLGQNRVHPNTLRPAGRSEHRRHRLRLIEVLSRE